MAKLEIQLHCTQQDRLELAEAAKVVLYESIPDVKLKPTLNSNFIVPVVVGVSIVAVA